ncbi:MAG: LysM peptidoglycan-binding domain-containing protein [Sedimentisphaerales bacterium]|nr:LysM peptidoglycan-binding domain-containing protein [Sedimentisphaerales bacterium]
MRKEFKIGMFLGLGLVIVGIIYLSMRKPASVEDRLLEQTQPMVGTNLPATDANFISLSDANSPAAVAAALDANTLSSGSTQPVANTTADLTKFEQAQPVKTQRFYIVHKGDMLSTISQKYYGTVKKVDKIYEANRNILKDKNSLKPGMKLVIPE